ncbi:MAG TPA: helix-turn-helix transcriptional regulator [Saprospiraceae bacterium]|nr:helix-turn-helix transcriptional regulator [Saprospiraceae bacterium]
MYEESTTSMIFNFIENRYYAEKSNEMVDDLIGILNFSKSNIYKKIKGESTLTVNDLIKLSRHFRFSLDELFGLASGKIDFNFPALEGNVKTPSDFVTQITAELDQLRFPDLVLHYATKELPLFYYFSSPELAVFKLHVFYNLIWKDDKHAYTKFNLSHYKSDHYIQAKIKEIGFKYMSLNTVEYWNVHVLDNTLNQIEYFLQAGLFEDSETALLLIDEMIKLVHRIKLMIEQKNKTPLGFTDQSSGSTIIYHNEIVHTNNVIFLDSPVFQAVYNTYDNPNFMVSQSKELCAYTQRWITRLQKNSTPISEGTIRDQQYFVNKLLQQIEKQKTIINHLLLEH